MRDTMCGIIGIINSPTVQFDIYNGLLTLQHRGQESAGILTTDGHRVFIHRGAELAKDIFNREILNTFKGSCGVGQVRYPTIGGGIKKKDRTTEQNKKIIVRNAQPSYDHTPGIATVHNGNIVNYWELRDELRRKRRYPHSDGDVDIINKIFASTLEKNAPDWEITPDAIFTTMEEVMTRKLKGSYSAITILQEKGFVAYRDPHGIRPFAMGEKDVEIDGKTKRSYGFASETVALDALGYKKVRDVLPGEVIYIPWGGKPISKVVVEGLERSHCFFEWIYFSRPSSSIENKNVYVVRLNLGRELAGIIKEKGIDVDIVAPVPDTSRPTALNLARKLDKPYIEIFDKNRYSQRSFILPTEEARQAEIILKLTPIIYEIRNKKILVVDDSIVRGPTSRKVVEILRDAGAKEVHFAIACPPITHRCYLGIDMVSEHELIAGRLNRDIERIEREIGADSLTYLPMKYMKDSIEMGDGLCVGCLTGSYPVEVSAMEKDLFAQRRTDDRGDRAQTSIDRFRTGTVEKS